MAFTLSTQTSYKLGFIASVVVGLKLLFDVATLPNSFSVALAEADKVTVSYSLVHGRAQLDGSRPLRLKYKDTDGSTILFGCSPNTCDRIPGFGDAEIVHVKAALLMPTKIPLSLSVNGVTHTFPSALAQFRQTIWIFIVLCAFGAAFSLLGWKTSVK
jgi:hypothetical protein